MKIKESYNKLLCVEIYLNNTSEVCVQLVGNTLSPTAKTTNSMVFKKVAASFSESHVTLLYSL